MSQIKYSPLQIIFGSFVILVTTICCKTNAPVNSLSDVEGDSVLFQVPSCLPSCTAADQAALVANSEFEKTIVTAIESANTSVQFSMYTFSRKPIFEALLAAAARGVRIQGIMDRAQFKTTAAACKPGGCQFGAPFSGPDWSAMTISDRRTRAEIEPIFSGGSNTDKLAVLLFGSLDGSGIRSLPGGDRLVHNKYVLIDGKTLLSGSGNWSSTAVSLNLENLITYSDTSSPEIVGGIRCSFDLLWAGDPNLITQNIAGCQKVDHLYLSPAPSEDRGPRARILNAIASSSSSIDISMHHLADPEVFQALEGARTRNVAVRMIIDDDDCNAKEDPLFTSLIRSGAKVKYMPTSCKLFQLSHSKYGIFDDQFVINGSANWSKAGLKKNYENFVVINSSDSSNAVGKFRDNFSTLWGLGQEEAACKCDITSAQCREQYCISE
jgi:phosphatidylserine/phosphatidylglycerophosphate/cardiolipin synthase-like enzyme